jgi:hypothetical protein
MEQRGIELTGGNGDNEEHRAGSPRRYHAGLVPHQPRSQQRPQRKSRSGAACTSGMGNILKISSPQAA